MWALSLWLAPRDDLQASTSAWGPCPGALEGLEADIIAIIILLLVTMTPENNKFKA